MAGQAPYAEAKAISSSRAAALSVACTQSLTRSFSRMRWRSLWAIYEHMKNKERRGGRGRGGRGGR